MTRFKAIGPVSLGLALATSAWSQSNPDSKEEHKSQPGAVREIGSGAGTIGTGAAKGAGAVAKGAGKGAADLVTLHPIDASASIGKGAANTGKDVTVGAAKGTGKVTKGIGRVFKKLF
jgi:hypothetical protein